MPARGRVEAGGQGREERRFRGHQQQRGKLLQGQGLECFFLYALFSVSMYLQKTSLVEGGGHCLGFRVFVKDFFPERFSRVAGFGRSFGLRVYGLAGFRGVLWPTPEAQRHSCEWTQALLPCPSFPLLCLVCALPVTGF